MFKFLKDKLKDTISKISDSIKSEGEEEVIEEKTLEEKKEDKSKEAVEPIKKEKDEKKAAKDKPDKEPTKKPVKKTIEEEDKSADKIEKPIPEVIKEEPVEKKPEVIEEKKTPIEEPKEQKTQKPIKEKKEIEPEITKKVEEVKDEKPIDTKTESIEKEPIEEKKQGFLKKIFGKKTQEPVVEPKTIEKEEKDIEEPIKSEETEIKEQEIIEKEEKIEEIKKEKPIDTKKEVIEEKPEKKTKEPAKISAEAPIQETKAEPEKTSIFSKIKKAVVTKKINEKQFEEIFWDLELALLENNVAVEVIDKIKDDLKENIIDKPLARGQIEEIILNTLKSSITEILDFEPIDIIERIKGKKPYVICFVGINGSGKTTTIAKMAHMLKESGHSCCLAAADTFRAAAIDQLAIHAEKLDMKIIKHDYGADPAAVAFDAIKHAESKGIDVVLIDTAGRIHSNINLQDEMKKIIRIANPDMKIFVGESITGNDCVEQATKFDESIGLDGIILSKADIDEKGGAAISISYVTKKPILYMGTGQEYPDIEKFDKNKILDTLF